MMKLPIKIISFNTCTAARDYSIPPHVHNFWQFYYVVRGEVAMTVSDKTFQLTNGDSMLLQPGVVRSPKCNGLPPQYMFVFFENEGLDLDGMNEQVLHANAEQQNMFQKLLSEIDLPKDRNSNEFMAAILIALLIELRRSLQHERPDFKEYYQEVVARVDTYMQSNFHQPLQRNDLARIAHVSPPHLARIFHDILQMTPLERLTQLRMQHAQLLLSQSNQPITSISAAVGYESISHFSRTFRKYSGKSPRQFRKWFFKN